MGYGSEVDRLIVGSHAGLFEGLGKSGVGVASPSQIFGTGSVLDTDHSLSNHLSSSRTHDVSSQDSVSLLVSQDLDHTVSAGNGFRSRVGHEGETSFGVFDV